MKVQKLLACSTAIILGLCVVTTWACDEHAKKSDKKSAATVASTTNDGRSESSGGCSHAAAKEGATVSGAPCSKTCSEECPHAKAMMAGATASTTTGSGCKGHAHVASVDSGSGCSTQKKVDAIVASFPSMKYRVGEEMTECPQQAASLAQKSGGKVAYVVGDVTFTDENEASAKLTGLVDEQLKSLQTIQYSVAGETMQCPMSAKQMAAQKNTTVAYRVGGFEFPEQAKAEQATERAKEALANVKISYQVGDDSFCCEKMAGFKAKETGKPVTYVVGAQQIHCSMSAQVALAQARVKAIVEAAAVVSGS